ncbi:MAG: DUF499 domain-containing protein [bacterium]
MGAMKSCKPRKEVLRGDLDDAIFAADFGNLVAGNAPTVYGKAGTFFQNTHPAKELCKVVQAVFGRLATRREGGATIRLSTGFGGGKTHTLMVMWHLAKNIGDAAMGTELLPAAARPNEVTLVAIDASKAGVPDFLSHGRSKVHSLWGEIFYQFGGTEAVKSLGRADNPEASPNEGQIEKVFPKGPVLILLDELVIYMAKLSDRGQGNVLGFLNSLSAVVSRRPQTALVVTDPARQVAYAPQSAQLAKAMQAAQSLDDVFDRKVSDFDPIGDESAQVITRRLFEAIDQAAAQSTSATYHSLYERVIQDSPGLLPADAGSAKYAERIVQCYPFHPRLLDTASQRLGALQDFQKSRGVLRLFARIIRDIWEAEEDVELITAGDINWSSSRMQADLLNRLNRGEFSAAIKADVDKHAGELDEESERGIHRRVASAVLLESIPLSSNSGMEPAEVTLAVLRPDEAGPEPVEALERLMGVCWHTYPTASGRGCQFRYEPNVLKQIEERMTQVDEQDALSRVLSEAQGYFGGITFKLRPWPTSAKQVPESAELQLALCEDEKMAKSVVAYSDDSDSSATMPRSFQNAIVAVAPTKSALDEAVIRARRLAAAESIHKENRSGDAGKLVREQLKRILPELTRQFQIQTRRTLDQVVLPGGTVRHMDETHQVPEDQILAKAHGQGCLRKFLEANNMIYEPGQALDVDRFLKEVLPGTTPLPDKPGVYTAKAVHERFLAAPGLRLLPDGSVVRQTVLKALKAGKVVIRLSDGRAYDANGHVEGPEGSRRRVSETLVSLTLDDTVLVTEAGSPVAAEWVKEDAVEEFGKKKSAGAPGPEGPAAPPAGPVTATTWEKVFEWADRRPLMELHFVGRSPSDAGALLGLAQPLGADSLALSVTTRGNLKDGGMMAFTANDVKPTHPAKPLTVAQTVFNSLAEGGTFEADLKLSFGASGRTGVKELLQTAAETAPEEVAVQAEFGKPLEVAE